MKVAIVGAGPAGLYLGNLLKRAHPGDEISVFEQNPRGASYGFGIAFSDTALAFLRQEDPDTYAALVPRLEIWTDSILDLKGSEIRIDGMRYSGISRLKLLEILDGRAREAGLVVCYGQPLDSLEGFSEADLIVGADGANSLVRRRHEKRFGTTIELLTNRFAWYGTSRHFDALTHTFVETELGVFNAHHHPHAPDMSTFVVEVDQETFARAGLDRLDEAEAKALCERVFADTLKGARLISNYSIWRRFPKVENARWSAGNVVLIGDALHTAHFSIGSGTRLAMEDALALSKALITHRHDLQEALAEFERLRRPKVEALIGAANASADWYENFREHMRLEPLDFAFSYITRSGRVSLERLRASSPGFMARYEACSSGSR